MVVPARPLLRGWCWATAEGRSPNGMPPARQCGGEPGAAAQLLGLERHPAAAEADCGAMANCTPSIHFDHDASHPCRPAPSWPVKVNGGTSAGQDGVDWVWSDLAGWPAQPLPGQP